MKKGLLWIGGTLGALLLIVIAHPAGAARQTDAALLKDVHRLLELN